MYSKESEVGLLDYFVATLATKVATSGDKLAIKWDKWQQSNRVDNPTSDSFEYM